MTAAWSIPSTVINVHLLFAFPLVNVANVLFATVILALLVMQIPLRCPVRFKPGEALRYP